MAARGRGCRTRTGRQLPESDRGYNVPPTAAAGAAAPIRWTRGAIIGDWLYRFRWAVVVAWLAAAGALHVAAPPVDPDVGEAVDLLPADTPVRRTLAAVDDHFGGRGSLSTVAVVFERADGPLTAADRSAVESVGNVIHDLSTPDARAAVVRTPADLAVAGDANPMLSRDGRAALITAGLPFQFISKPAGRVVRSVQLVVADATLPPGLSATVTGSAAFGYDYAVATQRSHTRTSIVTVVSVLVILLLVYRAPIAAAVPLVAVSVAAAVAFGGLAVAERFGVRGGQAERIFTFVLLYGAGVDYSMLILSRCREQVTLGRPWRDAVTAGVAGSGGAVACSAAMTAAGMATLCLARFSVFRLSGPAVVTAVLVAAAAALTLVPAVLAIAGPRTFSPTIFRPVTTLPARPPRAWPWVADVVVGRPWSVMTIAAVAMAVPAVGGGRVRWDYNSLASLSRAYAAPRGAAVAARHWGPGETAPVTLLVESVAPRSPAEWGSTSDRVAAALLAVDGVADVRAVSAPLGSHLPPSRSAVVRLFGGDRARSEYVANDGHAVRLTVVLSMPPLTANGLSALGRVVAAAGDAVPTCTVRAAGTTAEMVDLRAVTRADFRRTAGLALAVIFAVVTAVLGGDVVLSAFIVGVTLLSYFTALGLTAWLFGLAGAAGLEWKVQMLLFIVLVAVGQDYSLFFAARFAQEARAAAVPDAVRRAMVATGPVISSCGLIMAATLGSIIAADIAGLVQLGVAFVFGMLIDTFVVRPLVLPAFIVVTGRTLGRARLLHHHGG